MKQIIFIKEKESLILEMSNPIKLREFNNVLLFYLTQYKEVNAPLRLTAETKKYAIDFLKREYGQSYKQIFKVINFFEKMEIGECFYIYPYHNQGEFFYETCKESLKYYNRGMTSEEVGMKIKEYIEVLDCEISFMEQLSYNLQSYRQVSSKKFKGEADKNKRICIYCGRDMKHGATFHDEAHAIPEALGNKTYIQNEECDECNGFFAKYVEEDLCNWLSVTRWLFGIKGKNGYPTFQYGENYARYFDKDEIDANKKWGHFGDLKDIISAKNYHGPILTGSGSVDIDNINTLHYSKKYKPCNIYKALVKCIIGLIDKSQLPFFRETIQWLRYGKEEIKLPPIAIIQSKMIFSPLEFYIFIRKSSSEDMPYCYAELRIGDKRLVFIVPFSNMDSRDFAVKENFNVFGKIALVLQGEEIQLLDFSSDQERDLEYTFTTKK